MNRANPVIGWPYQRNEIFLGRDSSPMGQVGLPMQLLLCCGARPCWLQVFCDRGRSRAGVDWSAAILGAVIAEDLDWFEVFLGCGSGRREGTVI